MDYLIDRNATYVPASRRYFIMKKKSPQESVTPINIPKKRSEQLLAQFRELFCIAKYAGLYSYNLKAFKQQLKFKHSCLGLLYVLFVMLIVTVSFNGLVIWLGKESDSNVSRNNSTLTLMISLFLSYISLFMMLVDQFNGICSQRKMSPLYERFNSVDMAMNSENIHINNKCVSKRVRWLLLFTIIFEISVILSSILSLHNHFQWENLLWISFTLPTFLNSLDKIWFVTNLWALKLRFHALNQSIESLTDVHKRYRLWRGAVLDQDYINVHGNDGLLPIFVSTNYLNTDYKFLSKKFDTQRIFLRNRISPGD